MNFPDFLSTQLLGHLPGWSKPGQGPFPLPRFLLVGGRVLFSSLLVAGIVTGVKHIGGLEPLELAYLDFSTRQRSDLPIDPRITVLGITEADCQRYRCPLSDALLADTLSRLQAHSPRVVGLDIYRTIVRPPGRMAIETRLQASNLIAIMNVGSDPVNGQVPAPEQVDPERIGFNDFPTDLDGIIRRNLLYVGGQDHGYYAFGLRVALAYLGEDYDLKVVGDQLQIGKAVFPALKTKDGGYQDVDNAGYQVLLRYRGQQAPAAVLTLTQLLTGDFDSDLIRDRAILIGTTAQSSKDLFLTPFSSNQQQNFLMSGVEIHAHMVSQILDAVAGETALYRFLPPWSELLWLWGWCVTASLVAWSTRRPWQLGLAGSVLLAGLLGTGAVAMGRLLWLPIAEPVIGFTVTLGLAATHRLLYRTTHDPLTGLPNREVFLDQIQAALNRAQRYAQPSPVVVAFLGIDRFKVINESLGHQAGDQLLLSFAERLQRSLPPQTYIARVGGDEFAILFHHDRPKGQRWGRRFTVPDLNAEVATVPQVLDQLQQQLSAPFELFGRKIPNTVSIGVAMTQAGYEHRPVNLLRDAHTAMYRSKTLGQSRYEVFAAGMLVDAVNRLELESDLLKALENGEFLLYYQPIVHLQTGAVAGFEALVRWKQPDRGFVQPGAFIPAAEETGLILPLGQWIFQAACQQLKQWNRQFPRRHLTMSINLSSRQLSQPDLVQQFAQSLEKSQIPGDRIRLEITESMVMGDIETTIDLMLKLKSLNFKLAIDDFGTGYSSLSYLHRFPLDTLKVDKSFVGRVDRSNEDRAIVQTILTLGKQLGMDVVAEGIETQQQVRILQQEACDYGQGYLFAKPLPPEAAVELLRHPSPLVKPFTETPNF
ncbi:diguanylate cyclase [filamentous cyanobacterium CCP5]|nr:diguanylate cyclase [filamentous cyanobacterium CCP5]